MLNDNWLFWLKYSL